MTRAEREAEALRLVREQGLSHGEAGARVGLSKAQVWRALNPERYRESLRQTNARRAAAKRAWELENDRHPCPRCGELMGAGSHRQGAKQCMNCVRAATATRHAALEKFWAEGLTVRQIAERMGWTYGTARVRVSELRAAGLNLPHRRSPEEVERIAAGWARVRQAA